MAVDNWIIFSGLIQMGLLSQGGRRLAHGYFDCKVAAVGTSLWKMFNPQ